MIMQGFCQMIVFQHDCRRPVRKNEPIQLVQMKKHVLFFFFFLSAEQLQEIRIGAILSNLCSSSAKFGIEPFPILSSVIVTISICKPAMGAEPKNLSHIQQSRSYWTYSEIKGIGS